MLVVKNLPADAGDVGDTGSDPGFGRCPGGRNGSPLQYSCLENPMDRGAWRGTWSIGSQRVEHNWSDFRRRQWHSTPVLLPGKIPWTEEPGGLKSMELLESDRLRDFTFTFHFHALEKEMATHSSVLAWRIPGTEKSRGLPSMGSHRVGHDWSDLAAAAAVCVKYTLGFEDLEWEKWKLPQ